MKRVPKHSSAVLAALLLAGCISGVRPDVLRYVSADAESLSAFLSELSALRRTPSESEPFCSLKYSETEQMLYRDGKPVGTSFGSYHIQDGKLTVSGAGGVSVPVEEAAAGSGCVLRRNGSELTLESPFQNARLIVRSDSEPEQHGDVKRVSGYQGLYVMQYESPELAYQAYKLYEQDPSVIFVDSDRILHTAGELSASPAALNPDDISWGVADIGADWFCDWLRREKPELPEIHAAVIDTGIFAEHSWFEGRIADGGAGFIMNSDGSFEDLHGHGTHCAGIIVSSTPENVKILPLKALNDEGYGDSLEIYCAMMYAAEQKVDVVSMSLGGVGESPLLEEGCAALDAAGIPVCVAAGNDSGDVKYYHPANIPSCLTIGAVDENHELAVFSNYGDDVDFVTPGVSIVSASHRNPQEVIAMDGTSMATPFAAAAVADLLSYDPEMPFSDLYTYLSNNVLDLGVPGFDGLYGWGEISLSNFRFSAEPCCMPAVSPKGGEYDEPVDVELTYPGTNEADIYYTLDGSVPDPATAERYTKPIHLTESARLRAVSVIKSGAVSRETSAVYSIDGKDLPSPYEVRDGVLVAYHGVLSELDLSAAFPDGTLTAVGDGAFAKNRLLTKLILPDSVTAVGDRAFYQCKSLTELQANGVSSVGAEAFSGCEELSIASFAELTKISRGMFRECWLLNPEKLRISDKLTEIPDYAFDTCNSLSHLEIGRVTKIGKSAFNGCMALRSFGEQFDWTALEEIGDSAFVMTGFSGTVSLDHAKKLGENAFSLSNVNVLILPEYITEIPDGFASDCGSLRYVSASGVRKIGSEAFSHAYLCDLTLNMDGASIEEIGSGAFSFVHFMNPLSFENVTVIGERAFSNASGVSLSFPALKTVPQEAFFNCDADVLYFEHAETVEKNAVSGKCGVVFGDGAAQIAPDALQVRFIAAPKGSPAETYAMKNRISYYPVPYLLASDAVLSVIQGKPAVISAYPLGFSDLSVQWYRLTGEDAAVIDGATGAVLPVSTFEPGSFRFRAVLSKDGNLLTQADYLVNVTPDGNFPSPEKLKLDDTKFIRWDAVTPVSQEDAAPVRSAYFSYTAERSETLMLYLSGSACKVTVTGNNGTTALYDPDSSMYDEGRTDCPDQCIPVPVQKDVVYYFTLTTEEEFVTSRKCMITGLRLTKRDDLRCISEGSFRAELKDGDSYIFTGADTPVEPEFSLLELETKDGLTVLSDKDCIILYADNQKIGTGKALIFGAGDCWGSRVVTFSVIGALKDGSNCLIQSLDCGAECTFIFTPEKDGDFCFHTQYSDEAMQREAASGGMNRRFWYHDVSLKVSAPTGEEVYYAAYNYDFTLPSAVISLKKGVAYSVTVSNNEIWPVQALEVCVDSDKRPIESSDWFYLPETEIVLPDDGSPVEPEIICQCKNYELVKGRDYEVTYLFNTSAGSLLMIVRGIGDYRGFCMYDLNLVGNLSNDSTTELTGMPPDYESYYQFVPEEDGVYLFYTDYLTESLQKQIASDQYDEVFYKENLVSLELFDREGFDLTSDDSTLYMQYGFTCIQTYLEAGEKYSLRVSNYSDEERTGKIGLYVTSGLRHIGEAEVVTPPYYLFDGAPIDPELSVYCDNELTEGVDYTVEYYANQKPGTLGIVVTGIGIYCGRTYQAVEIRESEDVPEGSIHLNTAFYFDDFVTSYRFSLDRRTELTLVPDDGLDILCSPCILGTDGVFSLEFDLSEPITLEPGDYILKLRKDSKLTRRLILSTSHEPELTYIGLADVTFEPVYENGLAQRPTVYVRYDGISLVEGIDYTVTYPDDMIAVGSYTVTVYGIGRYAGETEVSCTVLPNPDKAYPLLQEGAHTAQITVPGQPAVYRWIPDQVQYCFSSTDFRHKRIQILTADGTLQNEMQAIGDLNLEFFAETDTEYYVLVSFTSAGQTGDLDFALNAGIRMLHFCEIECEDRIPFRESKQVPDYTLRYEGEPLVENVDYIVRYIGGESHIGKSEICLTGIGQYRGDLTIPYEQYPEKLSDFTPSQEPTEAECGIEYDVSAEKPGKPTLFTFTAPFDGLNTYQMILPSYVFSCFLYDADGNFIEYNASTIELEGGETIQILLIVSWLESDADFDEFYQFKIIARNATDFYFDEETGITYFLDGDTAAFAGYEKTDLVGIFIDSEIECDGFTYPILGFDPMWEGFPVNDLTFYTMNDFIAEIMRQSGCCVFNLSRYDYENAQLGDVNGDGIVSAQDAMILHHVLAEGHGMYLPSEAFTVADMTQDGYLDLTDVRAILLYADSLAVG